MFCWKRQPRKRFFSSSCGRLSLGARREHFVQGQSCHCPLLGTFGPQRLVFTRSPAGWTSELVQPQKRPSLHPLPSSRPSFWGRAGCVRGMRRPQRIDRRRFWKGCMSCWGIPHLNLDLANYKILSVHSRHPSFVGKPPSLRFNPPPNAAHI